MSQTNKFQVMLAHNEEYLRFLRHLEAKNCPFVCHDPPSITKSVKMEDSAKLADKQEQDNSKKPVEKVKNSLQMNSNMSVDTLSSNSTFQNAFLSMSSPALSLPENPSISSPFGPSIVLEENLQSQLNEFLQPTQNNKTVNSLLAIPSDISQLQSSTQLELKKLGKKVQFEATSVSLIEPRITGILDENTSNSQLLNTDNNFPTILTPSSNFDKTSSKQLIVNSQNQSPADEEVHQIDTLSSQNIQDKISRLEQPLALHDKKFNEIQQITNKESTSKNTTIEMINKNETVAPTNSTIVNKTHEKLKKIANERDHRHENVETHTTGSIKAPVSAVSNHHDINPPKKKLKITQDKRKQIITLLKDVEFWKFVSQIVYLNATVHLLTTNFRLNKSRMNGMI